MIHRPIGRPKTDIEKRNICIYLSKKMITDIDNCCKMTGESRAELTTRLFSIYLESQNETKMILQCELKDAMIKKEEWNGRIKIIEEKIGKIDQKENDKIALDEAQEKEKLEKIQAEIKESFKPELLIGKERFGIKITREMITAIRGA